MILFRTLEDGAWSVASVGPAERDWSVASVGCADHAGLA